MTDPAQAHERGAADRLDDGAVEAEPEVADLLFGERLPGIRAYARDLGEQGVELGLIGPKEPARLWSRHVLNCGLLAQAIPTGATTVGDIGSGAGLPGLIVAIARPDLTVTLIEPMQRRTDWLAAESERLGLPNVRVLRARAEEVPANERFDVVTARAVGALRVLIPLAAPLAVPGGTLMLMKGASVEAELAQAHAAIRRFGITDIRVDVVGTGMAIAETRIWRATVQTRASPAT